MRSRLPRQLATLLVPGLLVLMGAAPASAATDVACRAVAFPVTLGAATAPANRVRGELCSPPGSRDRTLQVAATSRAVDGVVLTGFLHSLGPAAQRFEELLYPAGDDPAFAGRPVPPGYLTTRPGAKPALFYFAPEVRDDVAERDEQTKERARPLRRRASWPSRAIAPSRCGCACRCRRWSASTTRSTRSPRRACAPSAASTPAPRG